MSPQQGTIKNDIYGVEWFNGSYLVVEDYGEVTYAIDLIDVWIWCSFSGGGPEMEYQVNGLDTG